MLVEFLSGVLDFIENHGLSRILKFNGPLILLVEADVPEIDSLARHGDCGKLCIFVFVGGGNDLFENGGVFVLVFSKHRYF